MSRASAASSPRPAARARRGQLIHGRRYGTRSAGLTTGGNFPPHPRTNRTCNATGSVRPSRPGSTAKTPACLMTRSMPTWGPALTAAAGSSGRTTVTRRARLGGSFLDHDLTPRVLAAVPPSRPGGGRARPAGRAGRRGAGPARDHRAAADPGARPRRGDHAAHELGSFDLALAIAFAVGADPPGAVGRACLAVRHRRRGPGRNRRHRPDRRADHPAPTRRST